MATLHSPTALCPASSRARVTMPTGLVKSTIHASGLAFWTREAMSRTTGTVRRALANPPAPVVSCPTHPHSSGQVSSWPRAACPPTRSWRSTASAPATPASRSDVVVSTARMVVALEHPPAEPTDEREPVLGGIDQDQLVDRERVLHPSDAVDQLRRVRRTAADDRDLHPFTPVSVTPSMKAFCAKKNTAITGAITSSVAAMVRFQFVWCALLNDASP